MRSVKINCINDLIEVHTAFNFFKSNFLRTSQTEVLAFLPFSDIYQTMIDNIRENSKLQLLAIMDDQPVGCVICQPIPNEKGFLSMPILLTSLLSPFVSIKGFHTSTIPSNSS